jgi:hypothetical protein
MIGIATALLRVSVAADANLLDTQSLTQCLVNDANAVPPAAAGQAPTPPPTAPTCASQVLPTRPGARATGRAATAYTTTWREMHQARLSKTWQSTSECA